MAEPKMVLPSIYAVLIRAESAQGHNIQLMEMHKAYSLEQAVQIAKQNLLSQIPRVFNLRLDLFVYRTLAELNDTDYVSKLSTAPPPNSVSSINLLMQKIITEKNVELFEQNRTKFNTEEIKFIQDKLNS